MPLFLLTFVEGLLGPKFAGYARMLIYAFLIILLIVGLGIAKCSYDKSVVDKHEAQLQQQAKKATDQAATERAADTVTNSKNEEEAHNAIHSVPDAPSSAPSHALACKRLSNVGKHPASCR